MRSVTGVLHIQIALVDEKVEQCLELGISEAPGRFGTIPCHLLQELENLIGANGIEGPLSEPGFKSLEKGLVASKGSWFQVWIAGGNPVGHELEVVSLYGDACIYEGIDEGRQKELPWEAAY